MTAETDLNNTITVDPQLQWTIEAATTALDTAVATLDTATTAFGTAVTAANTAQAAVAAALTAHTAASGLVTNTEYTDVTDAETALNVTLAAEPQVEGDITTDTGTLTTAVTALETFTGVLEAANTAQATVAAALAAYTTAGGLVGDAVYTNVTAADTALTATLAADPQITATVAADTATLDTAVAALDALSNWSAVVTASEAASTAAKTAHIAAAGLVTDAEYVAVVAAETALTAAIATNVPATITAAATDLDTAVAAMEVLTALLAGYDTLFSLEDGWTLVSTDYWVDAATSVRIRDEQVLKYTSTGFLSVTTLADLKPVEALYVQASGAGYLGINYSDAQQTVSTKELAAGWNLVSSATVDSAGAVFSPIRYGDSDVTGLATLVSQDSYNQNTGSLYLDATDWANMAVALSPFDGYWIYMNVAKSFGVIPD